MKITKTIRGEKYRIYIQFIHDTMECIFSMPLFEIECKAKISEDFEVINLCESQIIPNYLSRGGRIEVLNLKFGKSFKNQAMDANTKFIK